MEDSEDVRDGLVKAFFEGLGGTSNWLSVDMTNKSLFGTNKSYITISPVKPNELKETLNKIKDRLPAQKSESEFFSRFGIGDKVDFTTKEWCDIAFELAKDLEPNKKDEELEYIPQYGFGKIVAVKFTEAKVWYDVLDDYTGKVREGLDSCYIKVLQTSDYKREYKDA